MYTVVTEYSMKHSNKFTIKRWDVNNSEGTTKRTSQHLFKLNEIQSGAC